MPSFRIGFGSDFTLKNQRVGVGTADPRATLDVVGTLKGDLNITGVTTLTSYAGFVPQKQSGDDDVITTEVNTISEDIIVSVGKVFTVSAGATANIGVLENVSIGTHFSVPNGGTSLRPEEPVEGMVRFNNDLNTLEFWNGVEWRQFTVTGASGRGYFAGADPSTTSDSRIATIQISTLGNASYFGELSLGRRNGSGGGGCSSSTRGVFSGGYAPSLAPSANSNVIDYWTLSSTGKAADFGDLTRNTRNHGSCSSSTRGLFGGGEPGPTNTIDYIHISTIGNAIDFGDLTLARQQVQGTSSSTRGIFISGEQNYTLLDYVTIASTGNAVKFGDLSRAKDNCGGVSNGVRGVIGSGYGGPSAGVRVKTIDYITFASQGNAIDFGDRTEAADSSSSCNMTRGIFLSQYGNPPATTNNTMDYITITSTGNAIDFGDMIDKSNSSSGNISDSHGGLGGF